MTVKLGGAWNYVLMSVVVVGGVFSFEFATD